VERTHDTHWLSIAGSRQASALRGPLTRCVEALARWGLWNDGPRLGSVSSSWLREFEADSEKHAGD
jgi:hypothetical protein